MQEVVSRYEFLRELKISGIFTRLVHTGIIGTETATRISIYEEYLKNKEGNRNAEAIKITSDSLKVSVSNLYSIIRYMEN